jgi:hypothetical protein
MAKNGTRDRWQSGVTAGLFLLWALTLAGCGRTLEGQLGTPPPSQAVALPVPLAGLFKGIAVTLEYGVAIRLVPGQGFFGNPPSSNTSLTFAIILSSQAITCDTDFTAAFSSGMHLALQFEASDVGSISNNVRYLYQKDGWVNTGGLGSSDTLGTLTESSGGFFGGTIHYERTASDGSTQTSFIGGFTVQSCLD